MTTHAFIKDMKIFHVNGFISSLEEIPFGAVENGKYQEIAKRMETACEASGLDVEDHFVDVNKMITLAKGAQREITDIKLSRYA